MMQLRLKPCAMAICMLPALASIACAAEIRVFSTGAPSVAAKAIAVRDADHGFAFTVGQPATLRQKLLAGEKSDVVIAPAPVIAALEKDGKLRVGASVALARVGIGVVVREGAAKPDIATPDAIRKLLLEARSIAYPDPTTGGGFTGKALTRMIAEMGIADAIKSKLRLGAAINGGVRLVADGKAEVGLFNISEVLPVKGVMLVGPLPPALQHYIVFSAGIAADTALQDAAASFIKELAGPAARGAWTAAGLEPVARR